MRYSTYNVRNGAHVGWLNSQTTSRPPGRVTRSISRRPAAGSTMLRSPKEMVTASKVSSANGRRVPSPAGKGRWGRCPLPTWSIPRAKSQGTTSAPASANGWLGAGVGERLAGGAGAGGEVEDPLARQRRDGADHLVAPTSVLAEREHVVGDVVALGDGVEHPPHVGRLLVEVCACHAGSVGRAAVLRLCRGRGPDRLDPRPRAAERPPEGPDDAARQPNPTFSRLQHRDWGVLTAPRRGLPRRRTMRVVKALLTLALVVGL